MTILTILGTLLLGPLKLIFEIVFNISNNFIGNPGLSIIVLSLVMNILALPLYRRADIMQEEVRDIEAKLHKGVVHIKKTFSGDEKMMILQTYYRQNDYRPTDALRGSVSLLLEIPFFIAAYQFLSHLEILDGVTLGPIRDLGAPDGLLMIGGLTINLLPFVMTGINAVSSYLYSKGYPLKTKIQLYGMALIFLVLLYNSPAGLVFYWTLNNLFSLTKTILYKLENPGRVVRVITTVMGILFIVFGFMYDTDSLKRTVFLFGVGIMLQLPVVFTWLRSRREDKAEEKQIRNNKKVFVLGSLFLTILTGVLIPSTIIAASPQEFVDVSYFHNPLWYIVSASCLSIGTFMIWMRVFYWIASTKGKAIFDKLVWVLCGIMTVNYMFFGTDLGILSANLQYENGVMFLFGDQIINLLVLFLAAGILAFIAIKWEKAVALVLVASVLALGSMSVINVVTIHDSISELENQSVNTEKPSFQLSRNARNVVVIMLDRAVGYYIPYIMKEKPELMEKFEGFTYYDNVISYGPNTNFGAPPVFGGYEYTPVAMNKRNEEVLMDKHNESLKMMPKLFVENGFDVTVCDPPYANYQWIPDLSIYDDIPEVKAYITEGRFDSKEAAQRQISSNYRNFFCFSMMKSLPLFMQPTIYNNSLYNQCLAYSTEVQEVEGLSIAKGLFSIFMREYGVLDNMSSMTRITEEEAGAFLMMTNDLTHEPMLLQTPDYVPSEYVDNTQYDAEHTDRFTVNGRTLLVPDSARMIHYHANMAALLQLGEWFDFLRENDVYDNTRIILVSDHAGYLAQLEELIHSDDSGGKIDVGVYNPLLMVKDYNGKQFTTSHEFMTGADVPTMATRDVIRDPVNPYTGKTITNDEKYTHDQYIVLNSDWDISVNNGTTFLPSGWASIHDSIWDHNNWTFYQEHTVLDEHSPPQ